MTTPKQDAMIDRALAFTADQSFDGYPHLSDTDGNLIIEAAEEANSPDVTQFLAFALSEAPKTKEEAANAKRYYQAHVENLWVANATERCNEVWDEDE